MLTNDFRQRVEFVNIIKTTNASGGIQTAESTLAERWAKVVTKVWQRDTEADRVVQQNRIKMWCRVDPDLKAGIGTDTRVNWNGQQYAINGFDIVNQREMIFQFELNGI